MTFPFSATNRNNFKDKINIEQDKYIKFDKQIDNIEQKINLVKIKLHENGINVLEEIFSNIIENSMYYNRMNIYFLCIAYQLNIHALDMNLVKYVKTLYPQMLEDKYNFEIELYREKIQNIGNSLYIRIN